MEYEYFIEWMDGRSTIEKVCYATPQEAKEYLDTLNNMDDVEGAMIWAVKPL